MVEIKSRCGDSICLDPERVLGIADEESTVKPMVAISFGSRTEATVIGGTVAEWSEAVNSACIDLIKLRSSLAPSYVEVVDESEH